MDEALLRSGLYGFLRWYVGVKGEDGPPPSPFLRGAAGEQPLLMYGSPPGYDHELLFEVPFGSRDISFAQQIVVRHPDQGIRPIPVWKSMLREPAEMRRFLRERGLQGAEFHGAFADPSEREALSALVNHIWRVEPRVWRTPSNHTGKLEVRVEYQPSTKVARAIAKIGFHYMLAMFPELGGAEGEFEGIRAYIWNGTESSPAIVEPISRLPYHDSQRDVRPKHWGHFIILTRGKGNIEVTCQLYASPTIKAPTYRIRIGRDPSPVFRPVYERRAHLFVHDPAVRGQGFDGRMVGLRGRRSNVADEYY